MRKKTCRDLWVVIVGPSYTDYPWYFSEFASGNYPTTTTCLDYATVMSEVQAKDVLVKLPEDKPGRMVRLDLAIQADMSAEGSQSFTGCIV